MFGGGGGVMGYLDWQFIGIKPKVVSVSPFKEINISRICGGYLDWQFIGIKPKVVSVSPFKEINISRTCECKEMSSAPN